MILETIFSYFAGYFGAIFTVYRTVTSRVAQIFLGHLRLRQLDCAVVINISWQRLS